MHRGTNFVTNLYWYLFMRRTVSCCLAQDLNTTECECERLVHYTLHMYHCTSLGLLPAGHGQSRLGLGYPELDSRHTQVKRGVGSGGWDRCFEKGFNLFWWNIIHFRLTFSLILAIIRQNRDCEMGSVRQLISLIIVWMDACKPNIFAIFTLILSGWWWLCRAGEDCVSIMQRWATTVCSGPAPASQDTDLDILCGGGGGGRPSPGHHYIGCCCTLGCLFLSWEESGCYCSWFISVSVLCGQETLAMQ